MKPETLILIQARIKKFYIMYETLCDYWAGKHNSYPETRALCVLIQNAQFSGKNCEGYLHEAEVAKLLHIEKCAIAMKEYYENDYMIAMAVDELTSCISGCRMEEDMEAIENGMNRHFSDEVDKW